MPHTPFAVLPRPTYNRRALAGRAARRLRGHGVRPRQAPAAGRHGAAGLGVPAAPQNAGLRHGHPRRPSETRTIARSASTKPPEPPDDRLRSRPSRRPPRSRAAHRRPAPAAPPRRPLRAGRPVPPGTPRKKAAAAGPAAPPPRRPREQAPSRRGSTSCRRVIVGSLEDDKAEEVVALDLAGRASFADRMVIATGLADRQITAMATHLEEKLHEAGLQRVQVEGSNGSDWVLIDAGDIVVHLFKPDARGAVRAGDGCGAPIWTRPNPAPAPELP